MSKWQRGRALGKALGLGIALTLPLPPLPLAALSCHTARAAASSAQAAESTPRSPHSRIIRSGPKLPQSQAEAQRAKPEPGAPRSPIVIRMPDGGRLYRARASQPLLVGYGGWSECSGSIAAAGCRTGERGPLGLGPGMGLGIGIGIGEGIGRGSWPGFPYRYPDSTFGSARRPATRSTPQLRESAGQGAGGAQGIDARGSGPHPPSR